MSPIFNRSLANFFQGVTTLTASHLERFGKSIEIRMQALEAQRSDFDSAIWRLVTVGLERINEVLVPAYQAIERIQTKGFLIAESSTSASANVGDTVILIIDDPDVRTTFTPSPFVYLTRQENADDRALVQRVGYDEETGEFVGLVEASWGDPGPHSDWVIEGAAGSSLVAQLARVEALAARADAISARDTAEGHKDAAAGSAAAAGSSATTAGTHAGAALDYKNAAAISATAAADAQAAMEAQLSVLMEGPVLSIDGDSGHVTGIAKTIDHYTKMEADTTKASLLADVAAAMRDAIRLAMMIADLRNTVAGLAHGVADTFDDTSGVDAAASANESAQTGYYRPDTVAGAIESAQSVPAMTGNSAPAGHVASSSPTATASREAFKAFDQTTGDCWLPATSGWLRRQLPAALKAAKYAIISSSSSSLANEAPTAWTFEGSNDGSAWTVLDTRSSITWTGGVASQRQEFTITAGNRANYTYYRLNYSAVGGEGTKLSIQELEILKQDPDTYSAIDLRSVATTASAVPSRAALTFAANAVGGSVVPNTNLLAYVSRDGGTTWTQGTLVARETLSDGTTIYETGDIDISGQPSGTSMKWRLTTTAVAFEIRAHAAAMYWRT